MTPAAPDATTCTAHRLAGIADTANETLVRAAGGTWRTGITCTNGQAPPIGVLNSCESTTSYLQG